MEREKEALKDLVYYFKSDQKLVNFDKVTPRGYLLYGPPGTGKSYLMKALCGEAGDVHFIEIEPSKFDKTYVGEGNEELEKIWAEAEQYDKTIIFIDEISGLANREDKNTSQTASNIVNNLLTKLDGFKKSDKKIILMGATNHLEKIDSALRSRFSEEIKIDLIKDAEIAKFLKFLVKPFQISYHTFLHLDEIAKRCENKHYSNRDLTGLIEGAYYKKTNRYKYENPLEHEVMLPSDLDEVLDSKQNIVKSQEEITQRRKACEEQYATWKKGLQKYLPKSKDMTKVQEVYTFYGLEGLGYYQKILDQFKNNQHPLQKEVKTLLEQKDKLVSEVIALEQDQDKISKKTLIEQKQNAIALLEQQIKNLNNEITEEKELCEERANTQKEPTDLAPFVKYPFDQWEDGGVDYFSNFASDSQNDNTKSFFSNTANLFQKDDQHKYEFHFKGPKYLLELDQDCFIYPVNTPINVRETGQITTLYQRKPYYLHLNPVRKTLSLYTEKFNTGENINHLVIN
ncbi:MAG: AAA family ATPase [Candidatus Phytoplasma pruni]